MMTYCQNIILAVTDVLTASSAVANADMISVLANDTANPPYFGTRKPCSANV